MLNWFNKNNQNKGNLIFFSAFVAFFLISFRKIFLIKGILGHNWDWSFPALDFLFRKIDLLSHYAWWDFDLGLPLNLTLSQLGPNTLVKILAFLFPPKIVILFLLFLITLVAFISFKKLLDFVNQKTWLNYLPSFLYAFSPFLFNDIIGGSWYMWVSYAAAPLFFLNLVKFVFKGNIKFLLFFLIISIFTIVSLQHFLLIELIVFAYLLYQLIIKRDLNFLKIIRNYFLAQTALIVFNLFWLLPFVYSLGDFIKSASQFSFTGAFASVRYSTQNFSSIASLVGYLDRNLYYFVLTKPLVALMSFSVFLIWAAVLGFFIWGERKAKIKASGWLIILFLLALLIKGGNEPLGELTMWIYNHFPLMKLYRSPQHLMFSAAFIIPVLFSFSLNFFYQTFVKYRKMILAGFVFCLFFWLSGWWFNGDLGHTILKNQKRDYIDFYQLSSGIGEVYRQNEQSDTNGRVFFLPPVNSPAYLPNEYQNLAQGGQPEYMYLHNPTFTSENIFFAKEIQNAFCNNLKINFLNYLSLFSVKELVLRADIFPLYSQIDVNKCWSGQKVKEFLDSSPGLNRLLEDKYTAAYQVSNENFLPLVYIPEKIIEANGDKQDLREITDFKDYQIKSGIYLVKENEGLSQFKPVSDEIFIKAGLENQFMEEESAVNALKLQAVSFPYVQWKPDRFFYDFLLKRELLQENSLAGKEKELFQTKIFNAAKRISEVVKFFNKELSGNDVVLEEQTKVRYRQKMDESLELLKKIKGNDQNLFQTLGNDFYIAVKAHQNMIRQLNWPVAHKMKYEEMFDTLESELNNLKFKHDFQRLNYQFEINNDGEYQILLKTDYLRSQLPLIKEILLDNESLSLEKKDFDFKDWQELFKFNFSKGDHKLILILEESPNLLGGNWQKTKESSLENIFSQPISNYEPDGLYQLSFDYSAFESSAGFFITQDYGVKDQNGQPFPLIFKNLPQTRPDEFSHQTILIKAISFKKPAQISFFAQSMNSQSNQASFKNIKMERIFEPMIVLKKNLAISSDQGSVTPEVSFTKVNPTKYQVKVKGAAQSYNLIFNQSFNYGWKVYLNGSKSALKEEKHWLANGYANAWQIDVDNSKDKEALVSRFARNDELIIEYYPQRLFYIGLGISGLIIFNCFLYLAYGMLKRRKNIGFSKRNVLALKKG